MSNIKNITFFKITYTTDYDVTRCVIEIEAPTHTKAFINALSELPDEAIIIEVQTI